MYINKLIMESSNGWTTIAQKILYYIIIIIIFIFEMTHQIVL